MPEAVVVAIARSPIGRAFKGSLVSIRPDDLTVQMIAAALAKVPQLDPADIDDIMLGCGLPGGEQGYNMARVVAIMLGYDTCPAPRSPGTARPRCRPRGWPSTPSRPARATCSSPPAWSASAGSPRAAATACRTPRTRCSPTAEARSEEVAKGGGDVWHDPREDGEVPDVYIAMGQTAENVAAAARDQPRRAGRVRRPVAEPGREGDGQRLLAARHHARHAARRHRGERRRRPAARHHAREGGHAQAGVPPRRHGHGRQLLPAQRRRRRGDHHERPQGRRARDHAAGPDRRHRASARCPPRSWAWARSRPPGRRWPGPG